MVSDSHLVHYPTNSSEPWNIYINLYTYSYTGMPHSFPWCFCSGVIVCTAFQYSSLDYPHNRYVISHLHTRLERSLSMFRILPKIFFFCHISVSDSGPKVQRQSISLYLGDIHLNEQENMQICLLSLFANLFGCK